MKKLEQELVDKSLEANYHLWHAILTVNSLIAALFIGLISFSDLSLVARIFSMIGLSTVTYSCIEMVLNFKNTRDIYRKISGIVHTNAKLNEKDEMANLSKANSVFVENSHNEIRSLKISVISWLLLIFIMIDKLISPYSDLYKTILQLSGNK